MASEVAYSINSKSLELRSFSSKRAATQYGNGTVVFSSIEELSSSRIKDDNLRSVYLSVTGYETKVKDREYLSELLFRAIVAAKIPFTDSEMDFSIQTSKENVVTDQVENSAVESSEVESEKPAKAEKAAKPKREPKKRFDVGSDDPAIAFGVIPGSNRAKALEVLWAKKGQKVPISEIIGAVYNSDDVKKNLGPASLVVKGLVLSASKEGVKFSVTKYGKGANVEYTIDSK